MCPVQLQVINLSVDGERDKWCWMHCSKCMQQWQCFFFFFVVVFQLCSLVQEIRSTSAYAPHIWIAHMLRICVHIEMPSNLFNIVCCSMVQFGTDVVRNDRNQKSWMKRCAVVACSTYTHTHVHEWQCRKVPRCLCLCVHGFGFVCAFRLRFVPTTLLVCFVLHARPKIAQCAHENTGK